MTSTRDSNLPGGLSGLLAVLVLAAGGATACGEGSAEPPEEPVPSDLSALADRFWDAYLAWNPLQATYLGANRLNDRVRDISPSGRNNRRREVGALVDALAAIDFPTLPPDERLTWLALDHQLRGEIAQQTCDLEVWVVDHREGFQLDFLNVVGAQPLETPVDGERMIRRWNAYADYIDDYISNLRTGLETGRVAARASVNRTIVQLDALLERPVEEWPIYAPAGTRLDAWPEGTRHDFRAGIREAATERIRPAYARLRDFLRDELYPDSRTDGDIGLSSLPGGRACYEALIRDLTTLELTPDEIHHQGLAELEAIHEELRALGAKVLGTSDLAEIQARLRSDPEMFFRWPGEIVQMAEEAYARAAVVMPDWFGTPPRTGMVIRPIPLYEAPQSVLAYYREPAPDGSRPGTYFINTYRPEIRPRYQADVLSFHEAIPGHHLQTAIAQEVEGLPEFRKHLGSVAFVEGWALYAERLADEMGLYTDDLSRIGLASYDAWRASRLVVDTGIHAFRWTREQAIDFVRENTLLAEVNIENEVDRYITSPAQALTYKLGQLEILKLRAKAEARLGDAFSIAEFHDRVLENGALSLPALGDAIDSWLEEADG
ncbi:DUF885 domain-containing protein [Candidatus Palauibacter sp.]|uniref:DUF885 domain-containing protein n=1 Tax=Candidatus Palauibacter sp. TaxID=3101350 RepID=UPI003B018109